MKGLKARPPSKRVAPKHGLQAATQAHEEFMRELVRNGDADQSVTKPVAKPLAKSPGRTKTKSSSRRKTPKAKAKIETRSALSGARSPNVGQKLHAVSAPLEVGLDASAEWRSSVYRKLRPKAEESEVDFKWLEAIARTEGWHVRPSEVELKDALGQGSCGVVYTAKWRHLPVVAKKFLETATSKKEESQLRQRKIDLGSEISILSTVKHPNIVDFYGACFEGAYSECPLFLMEMCPKGDLETVIQGLRNKNSFLKEFEMAKYIYQIGLGIEYLHSCAQPIIHRDLKPQNILISAHGTAKLTDFGLATIIPQKTQAYQMTGHTGSLRYMAPEVFLGKHYSEKVDIYSYAMIIYYITACYRPFGNIRITRELAVEIANADKRPEVSKIRYKAVRTNIAPLLHRAWSPAPSARPHCHEILAELESFAQFRKFSRSNGCSIC